MAKNMGVHGEKRLGSHALDHDVDTSYKVIFNVSDR